MGAAGEHQHQPVAAVGELIHPRAVGLELQGNRSAQRKPVPEVQVEGELGHPILAAAPADGPLHREAAAETPQRQEQTEAREQMEAQEQTTAQAQTVRRALRAEPAAVAPHHQQEVPGAPEARAAEEAPEAHLAAHRTSQVGAELARRLGNRAGRNQDSARTAPVEPEEPED